MTPPRLLPDMDSDEREFVREFSSQIETLAARTAACPPFDRAVASREGVLPEPEQTAVAAHMQTCAACQALLRDTLDSEFEVNADLARGRARLPSGQPGRAKHVVALNVPLIDLEPIGALRSGTPSGVSVPASATLVTLVLAIPGTPAGDGYTLDIRDPMDRVIWSGGGLEATSSGTVTLAVPRALLPRGTLTLRLTAVGASVVHRYTVRIDDIP